MQTSASGDIFWLMEYNFWHELFFHELLYHLSTGASIPPKAMMYLPLVSEFPLFPKNFSDSNYKFQNFPLLSLFPLLFLNSPLFHKICMVFTYFLCFSLPPYFDHDAFMHHPMHVLFEQLRVPFVDT